MACKIKSFLFCLIAIILTFTTTTTAISLAITIPWDSSLFSTQMLLESQLKSVIAQCTIGRPTHSRLLGGDDVLHPKFYIEVTSTDDYTNSCHPTLQGSFPNVAVSAAGGSCFITNANPSQTGFVSGISGCPAILGSKCVTQTFCAKGTSCPTASDVCSIVPTLTYFDVQLVSSIATIETSPSNVDQAYKNLQAVEKQVAAVFSADKQVAGEGTTKCPFRDVQLVSVSEAGATVTDKIQIIVGSEIAFTQSCLTTIKTIQTTGSESLITSITTNTASPARLEKACFTTDKNGFISKFTIGGSCSLSRPLGYACQSGAQVCPDPNSTCDFIGPVESGLFTPSSFCVLHDPNAYFTANFINILTYESSLLVSTSTPFAVHAVGALGNSACSGEFVPGSGTLAAVPSTITKFQFFFISQTAVLSAACIEALQVIDATAYPQIKSVTYSTFVQPPTPKFSCFATTFTQNPLSYSLDRIIPGGRCDWKVPLGGNCLSNMDCDSTSTTTCIANTKTTGLMCSRPGLIPDATDLKLARLDIEATAYLGSKYGKSRLETFVTKLKVLCPFESFVYNIASLNYSKAQLWVTPFDYESCTQQFVQTAALQANQVAAESLLNEPDINIVGVQFNAQSQQENDLDFDPATSINLVNSQERRFTVQNEEGEETPVEPTPEPTPIDPSSIIPRLKYASIKTYSKTLPLECASGESITCAATNAKCDVPCSFGTPCLTDAHCGSFGKCVSGACAQRGSAFLPPTQSAISLSIFGAFAISLVVVLLA